MKKLYFFILICFTYLHGFCQIEPFYGIYDLDSCHFEDPCHLTVINNSDSNIWQVGTPQKTLFNNALSIPFAIITDSINPYPANNHSYFDVVLNNWGYYGLGIIVGFSHKINTDTLTDGGYIEVSYDKGQSWNNIAYEDSVHEMIYFGTENLYKSNDTLKGGIPGFSGTIDEWKEITIQWVWAFPVKWMIPDTFMLRFHFISDDINTNKEGWMIDNLMISFADLGSSASNETLPKLNVYPNPMADHAIVTFDNPDNSHLLLNITDLTGEIIRTEAVEGGEAIIERKTLRPGVYLLTLMKDTKPIGSGKLLIN